MAYHERLAISASYADSGFSLEAVGKTECASDLNSPPANVSVSPDSDQDD